MDGLTNVTNQQQTQQQTSVNSHENSSPEKIKETTKIENKKPQDTEINSKEDVENLVEKLNEAVEPLGTSLKFGVDKDNTFFVSVIDQKTNDVIRRFPAEKGMDFLPKMQEVSGILFDSKG